MDIRGLSFVASGTGHLWGRNIHHADFLRYRLGLGAQPFQAEIRVPSERFDLIDDSGVLENEAIAKFLLDAKRDYGFTTLLLSDRAEDLPNRCECVIANTNGTFTLYRARESENEIEMGGEIPNVVTFFDMYGIERPKELHVEERWKRSRTDENMRALIGQKSGGQRRGVRAVPVRLERRGASSCRSKRDASVCQVVLTEPSAARRL